MYIHNIYVTSIRAIDLKCTIVLITEFPVGKPNVLVYGLLWPIIQSTIELKAYKALIQKSYWDIKFRMRFWNLYTKLFTDLFYSLIMISPIIILYNLMELNIFLLYILFYFICRRLLYSVILHILEEINYFCWVLPLQYEFSMYSNISNSSNKQIRRLNRCQVWITIIIRITKNLVQNIKAQKLSMI